MEADLTDVILWDKKRNGVVSNLLPLTPR